MKQLAKHVPLMAVVAVAAIMLLPFLGLSDFNTKGEPREAVVALSMLKDGNWVLPVNNGCDIPYKPPFFHYCVAVVSLVAGGVSEYTSRLPSALALIALAAGCFAFYRRRMSQGLALSGALLLLTSFEVHRAAINCRVDMVLTAFTVGAMMLFYRWWERGSRGVPVWAVLCMSGAVLTKGPVGFIVPCFVMVVFTLLRGGGLWRTLLSYGSFALLSMVLPAVWYVAAWHEGGSQFLSLVYEENIGRMTGTMSYESHEHNFAYNFLTLLIGWAPWALLLVMSAPTWPWRRWTRRRKDNSQPRPLTMRRILDAPSIRLFFMRIPPVRLFTWLGFVLVLFFYCLPSSKRSVYLLPCYPFMAMLIAQYVEWLWSSRRRGPIRAYVCVVAALAVALTAVFATVRLGFVPDTIFHGKHADANVAMLHALRYTPLGLVGALLVALPVVAAADAVQMIVRKRSRDSHTALTFALFVPVVLLFTALDGVYQPMVLNTKSLRPLAATIAASRGGEPLYQHVEAPMMHFFGADFYLGDALDQFEKPVYSTGADGSLQRHTVLPDRGVLVVSKADFDRMAARHPDYTFRLQRMLKGNVAEVKGDIGIYRFCRNGK